MGLASYERLLYPMGPSVHVSCPGHGPLPVCFVLDPTVAIDSPVEHFVNQLSVSPSRRWK
jgi:hypothetical protein